MGNLEGKKYIGLANVGSQMSGKNHIVLDQAEYLLKEYSYFFVECLITVRTFVYHLVNKVDAINAKKYTKHAPTL